MPPDQSLQQRTTTHLLHLPAPLGNPRTICTRPDLQARLCMIGSVRGEGVVEAELRGKVGEVERRRWHLIDNWPPCPTQRGSAAAKSICVFHQLCEPRIFHL